jgi:Bacterial pre-peptidase C-terminal domain
MKPRSARLIGAALVAAVAVSGGMFQAAHAQPNIANVVPGALQPGQTTEITLHGTKLDGPLQVWTSFPAQVEVIGDPKEKNREKAVCKVSLSAGVPVGIGGVVVTSLSGASDVLFLMVDDLPSVAEGGQNHAAGEAQDVSLPVAIDGLCDGTQYDYFRFAAKKGERISCEVVATRLGSDFDPLVRILDASENELILADDDRATGADSRVVFTAPADGQYVLELRDNRYKPGGRYRLRLGDFPLVASAMPLAVQQGVPAAVSFLGELMEGTPPLTIFPLAGAVRIEAMGLGVKSPAQRGSGWATLELTDLPVFTETASLAEADHATPLNLPGVAAGMLEAPGDRDVFQFAGSKGTPIRFRAISRSAGSAAVVSLRILDANNKQLAESPVTESDEPAVSYTLPADGTYKLAVEELIGRGGPEYAYAVEGRTGPQFSLALKNDKNNRTRYALPDGGAFYLDVQCQRFGYDGPVSLSIDSPRSGWQTFNPTIAAKANEVKMYVVPPDDLAPGEMAELRVVGRGTSGNGVITSTMATTVPLRTARPQMPYPPAWLDGIIFVSGINPRASFYKLTSGQSEVELSRFAGEAKITLDFERTDPKFVTVPLSVLPVGLPPGLTAAAKRNGNGVKETYDITLKGPKDLAEGQYTFRYFAFAELATQGRGLTGDVRLNVVSPLTIAASPAGPLVIGKTQKVKLTVTRRGEEKEPVEVKLKALPKGVTGPEKATIAADHTELEIELTAAADAEPVKFDKLVAVATSKAAGTEFTVESQPATLEVKAP